MCCARGRRCASATIACSWMARRSTPGRNAPRPTTSCPTAAGEAPEATALLPRRCTRLELAFHHADMRRHHVPAIRETYPALALPAAAAVAQQHVFGIRHREVTPEAGDHGILQPPGAFG